MASGPRGFVSRELRVALDAPSDRRRAYLCRLWRSLCGDGGLLALDDRRPHADPVGSGGRGRLHHGDGDHRSGVALTRDKKKFF